MAEFTSELMKCLWLENNQLILTTIGKPKPLEGEALVRVLIAGICSTDLELKKGYYPYTGVIGHEFVGIVEDGPVSIHGKRVVGEINATCSNCWFCHHHLKTHCSNRTVLGIVNRNGAFAEYLCLPFENLLVVPDNVPTELATFTEPLAAALEIQQQISITESDRVLVVGDGKLGQLISQTIALTGCHLLVIGRHEDKLELLRRRGIATGFEKDLVDKSFDISVECTGSQAGFSIARRALRPRGTLIMKSTYAGQLTFDASSIVVDEISIIGSRCGPFAPALELLSSKKVDIGPLIQQRFSLDQGLEAFELAKTRGTLKVLIDISSY